jgi:hypothetical protein
MGFLLRDTEPESAASIAANLPTNTVQQAAACGFAHRIKSVRRDGGLAVLIRAANGQIMRNGQNKRMRGRNNNHAHSHSSHGHRKSHNPMARVYESNGPEVKIRGNPAHIAEKYMQLARDAQTSGDPVSAENYFQHAEHYFRLIAAAQEQFRQNNPHLPRQETEVTGARDENFEDGDGDEDAQQPQSGAAAGDVPYGMGEQPYLPRDAQPFPHREQPQPIARPQQAASEEGGGDIDRLPSFITGGQGSPQSSSPLSNGQNGHEPQGDRFPLHRRRRRHRGPRHEAAGGESRGEQTPREE